LAEVEDPRIQTQLLETVSTDEAADILEEMQPDEAADLLGELPHETSSELLRKMEGDESVENAFARLRQAVPDVEAIYYIFVIGTDGRLVGVLNLRQLIGVLAPEALPLLPAVVHREECRGRRSPDSLCSANCEQIPPACCAPSRPV